MFQLVIAERGGELPPPTAVSRLGWLDVGRLHWARGNDQASAWRGPELLVVAEGRLDSSELQQPDSSELQQPTVATAVASAYRSSGESLLGLEGDFAYVIHDLLRARIIAGRDLFGTRSLYYRARGRLWAFATESRLVRTLVGDDGVNEARLADYLMGVLPPASATFYQGVQTLPPACRLDVGPHGSSLRREERPPARLRPGDPGTHATRLRGLLARAVARRVAASRHPALLLSGGLDSGSLATVLPQRCPPIPSLTLCFPSTPSCDESRCVEQAYGRDPRLSLHFVGEQELSTLDQHADLLVLPDGPTEEPNALIHTTLLRRARDLGVDLVLDGLDGDAVVGHGYHYLSDLLRARRWSTLLVEADALAGRFEVSRWHVLRQRALLPVLRHLLPVLGREAIRRASVLAPSFRAHTDAATRARLALAPDPLPAADRQRGSLASTAYPLALAYLQQLEGHLGVTSAHPFLDAQVVEHCLATPIAWQLHQGWPRWIQRVAFPGLSDAVRWRARKTSLGPAVRRAMLRRDRDALRDATLSPTSALRPLIDPPMLGRAWRALERSASGERAMSLVWRVALLSRWLDRQQTTPGDHP